MARQGDTVAVLKVAGIVIAAGIAIYIVLGWIFWRERCVLENLSLVPYTFRSSHISWTPSIMRTLAGSRCARILRCTTFSHFTRLACIKSDHNDVVAILASLLCFCKLFRQRGALSFSPFTLRFMTLTCHSWRYFHHAKPSKDPFCTCISLVESVLSTMCCYLCRNYFIFRMNIISPPLGAFSTIL